MRWTFTAILAAMFCPVVCRGQALADHVPADAIVYAGWHGADAPMPGYEKSHLQAVLNASELPQFISQSVPMLMARIVQDNPQAADDVEEATKWLTLAAGFWKYPCALYIGGVDAANMGLPKAALLCDAGTEAGSIAEQISTLLAGMGLPIHSQAVGTLVVTADFDYPAQIDAPLSQDPEFTRLVGSQGKSPMMVFYMDGAAVLGAVDQLVQLHMPADFQQRWVQIRQASGLTDVQHVVVTSGFEKRNWVTQSLVEAPAPREGWLAMADAGPLADALIQRIPQTSTMVRAGSFDLNAAFGLVQPLVTQFSPDGGAQFNQVVGMANGMLGMDVRKDLLGAFGTQWASYADPVTEGDGVLGMVVLNRPADPVKLADSLHRMQNAVNGLLRQTLEGKVTLEFRGETVAGTEMNYFAAPLFSPTWAIGDGTLYVGLYPQVVAAALARPAGSRSILANAAFGRVRQEAGAPSKVSAIVFNDLTRTVPQGYQTVLLMSRLYLGLGDIFGAQSPPLVLPTLTQLKPELEPSGGFAWADSVGLHAKFVTPFPGADALGTGSMAGVGVGEIMAMMTSIGLPSLNQARGTANKVKSANNLRQIGLGIMLYANDNRGKFPPDFGTLLKNEDLTVSVFFSPATNTVPPAGMTPDAAAAWVNANSDYVYLGSGLTNSTATADTVLAYEKETVNGGEGINLLFGDGHVEFNTLPQAHAEIDASKKSRGL